MGESTRERATSGSGRVIRLRYAGRCGCGAQLPAGSTAGWNADAHSVTCLDCLKATLDQIEHDVVHWVAFLVLSSVRRRSRTERSEGQLWDFFAGWPTF